MTYNGFVDWIYLDNNASTKPAPQVVEAMTEMATNCWANASSVHRFGQMARHRIELARAQVASLIGCRDRDLIMTCGGTESNNLALHGYFEQGNPSALAAKRVLITNGVEHAAIREPAQMLLEKGVFEVRLSIVRNKSRYSPPHWLSQCPYASRD